MNDVPGARDASALSAAFAYVLLNTAFPVSADGTGGAEAGDCLADDLIIQGYADFIALVGHRAVRADPEARSFLCRVDIRAEEKKLPAVLFLLVIDHAAHRFIVVAAAGIFLTVGGDDEERLFRYVLRAGILVYVPDVMDGSADSVKQRCAAAGEIFLLRHGRNFAERQTVVDDCAFIVEEHE